MKTWSHLALFEKKQPRLSKAIIHLVVWTMEIIMHERKRQQIGLVAFVFLD